MQIKNRKSFLFSFFLSFFIFNLNLNAEEFDISAKEILIDKENKIIIGKGSVVAIDSDGKRIDSNKIIYEKSREFLLAEGEVKITDINGNKIEDYEIQTQFGALDIVINWISIMTTGWFISSRTVTVTK